MDALTRVLIMYIVYTDEDRKDKRLRKDIDYLNKVFKGETPKWLVDNVIKIRRNDRKAKPLSRKSIF